MGDRSTSSTPQPGSEALTHAGRESPAGEVSLRRLLTVVTLSPRQTGVITLDLAAALDDADAAGRGWPHAHNLYVTSTGRLRITADDHVPTHERDDASALATAVVGELRANAARGGGHADELLLPVENSDPAALAGVIRTAGHTMIGSADEERIERARVELGALVAALRGQPTTPVGRPEPEAASRPPRMRPDRTPRRSSTWPPPGGEQGWHRRGHSLPRRSTMTVVVLVALGLLAWWAAPRVGPELQREWDALFSAEPLPKVVGPVTPPPPPPADDDASTDETADDGGPMDVEPPAPASAGPITGVSVEPEGGACAPGQECLVRVQVDLERAGTTRRVEWSLDIVDRCSGEATTRPGHFVNAQPGWTHVWGNTLLDLPDGTALAVVAVTDAPADAASPPLLLPADGSC